MRSIIGKFNASVFRLIISALLLGTCNEAFSLNTQPIQNPPTYTGTLQGEAPCNTTYRCAVPRHGLSAGANPARQLSLRPVAIGAVVEATKRLKPSVQRISSDLASVQAVT